MSALRKTEPIPVTGHVHTEPRNAVAPGCETAGYSGDIYCIDCGTLVQAGQPVPATGHFWDAGVITQEPTCTASGTRLFTCASCGSVQTEPIAALGHNYTTSDICFNGYTFGTLYTCVKGDNVYFVEAGSCTNGADCPSKKFTDADQTKWYHKAIDFTVITGLFAGTSDTTFSPAAPMTREQLVQVLYNLEGHPAVTGQLHYTDTVNGKWYTNAVLWASNENIVVGYDDGSFGINVPVTREQIAAILYRYAVYKGYDVSDHASLDAFPDANRVSSWAKANMEWAVGADMISGSTNNGQTLLFPAGNAERAQVASIIMRFVRNIHLNIDAYEAN